jgi:hypothetical protein
MRKRAEKLATMPNCGNIRYYGLHQGQVVHVKCTDYEGLAVITGQPPQGTGIYLRTPQGRQLWLGGEQILEATEPT